MRKPRAKIWTRYRWEIRAGVRGIFWGLVLPGPVAALAFIWLSFAPPPGCLAGANHTGHTDNRTIRPVDLALSTPELAIRLAPVLRGTAVLIAGSSESAGRANESSLHSHLLTEFSNEFTSPRNSPGKPPPSGETKTPPDVPFLSIEPKGSAAFQTALMLERLRPHLSRTTRPVRIVVLDNSHYATNDTQHWPDLRTHFPDDASLLNHADRFPATPLARIPFFQQQLREARARTNATRPFAALLPGEIAVFRSYLSRVLVAPVHRGLAESAMAPSPQGSAERTPGATRRNPDWGVEAAFVPPRDAIPALRARKNLPAELKGTVYDRSLRMLGRARAWLPAGSRIDLIVLPFHYRYYQALGLDGRALETRRLELVRSHFPDAQYADWMAAPAWHSDSIHYTDAGRVRLAREIRQSIR